MARQPIDLPSQSSGAGRVRFSVPQRVPGLSAEANRALLDAFAAIQQELVRLSAAFVRVPLIDSVQELRDGQIVRGVGDGNTLVLPGPPAYQGIRVVLDDVASAVTVVAPDATEHVLTVAGVYDFMPASDDGETYETAPFVGALGNVTSGVVLGRETAGSGPVEELTVGGGLELNSGLQIADLGVATGKLADAAVTFPKLVDAPSAGFIGATVAGDYEHRTTAQVAAVFASTSIVVSGSELQRAAVSGDVLIPQNSNTATIANDAVTNAKLANMAAATFKGRPSGAGTGDPVDLNAASITAIVSPLVPGRLIAVTAYTTAASGTHTFDADATSAEVFVVGAGGGGGGANGPPTFGAGGGAGALNYAYIPDGSLPASMSYTVGAAGAGGSAITSGSAGGNSSVTISASVHTAGGGAGGGLSSAPTPGLGGTSTAGTFTVAVAAGGAGHFGLTQPGASVGGGNGGASAYAGGARGGVGLGAGGAGSSGAGGGGGATTGAGQGGGAGGAGLIIVKEYA